ncbi:MAG: hypothetical protein AB8B72_00565 [Crocinitomicaceae bacterium]
MKGSILFTASLLLLMSISSCKKEVIEIVGVEEASTEIQMNTKSVSKDDSNTDNYGAVTDPDEDEDFDADKKNTLSKAE